MKYLKTYEGDYFRINMNDYVLIKEDQINNFYNENIMNVDRGKVIKMTTYSILIELIDSTIWKNRYDIERKLTPDEIDEFEAIKNSKKYNL